MQASAIGPFSAAASARQILLRYPPGTRYVRSESAVQGESRGISLRGEQRNKRHIVKVTVFGAILVINLWDWFCTYTDCMIFFLRSFSVHFLQRSYLSNTGLILP